MENADQVHAKKPVAKSQVVAGLLAFFLGALGVHNFYLGFVGRGLGQLLLTVGGVGVCAGAILRWSIGWAMVAVALLVIVAVWNVVDAILIFKGGVQDAKKRALG